MQNQPFLLLIFSMKAKKNYIICTWKGLGRQLSMRTLGAKLKFPVGHGKFNFPPLYAEIASSGRIPVVSFAIETVIAVDMKRYPAWIILEILSIFRPLISEKMASRKTEVWELVGWPILSPEYALFIRLRWGGWNILLGLLGLVLPQIPAKKTASCYKCAIVESIVE